MYDDLILDYETNKRKSLRDLKQRWEQHLKPFFGYRPAIKVTTQLIKLYVKQRLQEEAANATINRELAGLKRAFNLALQSTPPKLTRVPHFPHLAEDNIRTGFVEPEQYTKLADEFGRVGLWMRSIFETGYTFGWRRSEVVNLRVRQVDLTQRIVTLDPGTTKNKKGRTAKMTETLFQLLSQCCVGKNPDDYVFTHDDGSPVLDFRGTWQNGCSKRDCLDCCSMI